MARREGANYKAKFGQYEIFSVAEAIAKEASARQTPTRDVIFSQCMTSQLLVVRPDANGSLQPVEVQEWSAPFPRYPAVQLSRQAFRTLASRGQWWSVRTSA